MENNNQFHPFLALLVEQGVLDSARGEMVEAEATRTGRKISAVCKDYGYATDAQLLKAAATHIGVPYIDLDSYTADPLLSGILPETFARAHCVVVLRVAGDRIAIATKLKNCVNPAFIDALSQVSQASEVTAMAALSEQVEVLLDLFYGEANSR